MLFMAPNAPISPLQKLAFKWQAIAAVIIAFTRLMRRYEDGRMPGAGPQAEQLQIIVRSAQIMLMQELAETLDAHPPKTEQDALSLAFLRFSVVSLLAIHLVLERVLQRGLVGAFVWQQAGPCARNLAVQMLPRPISGFAILDPG